MIPPTSIDGTDITGATIDGTDVTEITVDGDVVFSATPPGPQQIFKPVSGDENAFSGAGTATFVNKSLTGGGGNALKFDNVDSALGMDSKSGLNNYPTLGDTVKVTVRNEKDVDVEPFIGIGEDRDALYAGINYATQEFVVHENTFGGAGLVTGESVSVSLNQDYEIILTVNNDSSVDAELNDFTSTLATISTGQLSSPGGLPAITVACRRLSFIDTEAFFANARIEN